MQPCYCLIALKGAKQIELDRFAPAPSIAWEWRPPYCQRARATGSRNEVTPDNDACSSVDGTQSFLRGRFRIDPVTFSAIPAPHGALNT